MGSASGCSGQLRSLAFSVYTRCRPHARISIEGARSLTTFGPIADRIKHNQVCLTATPYHVSHTHLPAHPYPSSHVSLPAHPYHVSHTHLPSHPYHVLHTHLPAHPLLLLFMCHICIPTCLPTISPLFTCPPSHPYSHVHHLTPIHMSTISPLFTCPPSHLYSHVPIHTYSFSRCSRIDRSTPLPSFSHVSPR